MVYFLVWLVVAGVDAGQSVLGFKCFIYFSYWGFLLWSAYLLYAAVATTVTFLRMPCSYHEPTRLNVNSLDSETKLSNGPAWTEKLHWLLFTLGNEAAVSIVILFWVLFHNTQEQELLFNPISLHIHLINGIFAIIDLWLVSIPVCLTHAVYIMLFGLAYVVFTGIYYALNGTDPGGHSYIYPMLDYKSNPGAAAGLALGCVFAYLFLIHLVFFALYLIRSHVSRWVQEKCYCPQIRYVYLQPNRTIEVDKISESDTS